MKNDKTYLEHILEAIEKIQSYLGNAGFNEFSSNNMMIDATIRELEIIGEASNNLSGDFHIRYPDISFRDAVDMRNFLIHEYFGVNVKVVWDTCRNDLPKLKSFVEELLNE
jgi:uncharacterized protein with HEPN domain